MNVLNRLHIQDQVLKYLCDRKSAQTQPHNRNPTDLQCLLPILTIEATMSVTIDLSIQKNVTVKTMANSPGKPFCLQESKKFDNPTGTQFVLPIIMDNNACTITALAYAVREPGRPPGNSNTFTLYGQPHIDKTFQTVGSNSNFTMKTDSNQAQKYAVRLNGLYDLYPGFQSVSI